MFDVGWSELVVIGIVALVVIGPKELPGVLRMVGQWMTKVRRMAAEFQGQFQEAMREAEMADLKKQVDQMADSARNMTSGLDPIETARREMESAFEGKPNPAEPNPADPKRIEPPPVAAPEAAADAPLDRTAALAAVPETTPPTSVETVSPPAEPARESEPAQGGGRPA